MAPVTRPAARDQERTKNAACARVFNTVELLECILQDLSATELTRARHMNSFFRNVIDNSTPLRRIMFLEPIPKKFYETYRDATGYWPDDPPGCTAAALHPAIRGLVLERASFDILRQPSPIWASGQWKSMLISQPPAVAYHLVCKPKGPSQPLWKDMLSYVRVDISGPTLGGLVVALTGVGDALVVEGIYCKGLKDERSKMMKSCREKRAAIDARGEVDDAVPAGDA